LHGLTLLNKAWRVKFILSRLDDFLECGGLPPLCHPQIVPNPKAGASSRTPNVEAPEKNLRIVGKAAPLRRPKIQGRAAALPYREGEDFCPAPA